MANEWELTRATGKCAATGREFAQGESYFAVLFDSPEGFERKDYAEDAWQGPPEGCFCYWRGRVPVREKSQGSIVIDHNLLCQLFLRLEEEESELKQQFRFVLALLLLRKRFLKFEGTVEEDEREYWRLRLVSDQSVHQVVNPRLTDEQQERLNAQLQIILSGELDALESLERAESAESTADQEVGG